MSRKYLCKITTFTEAFKKNWHVAIHTRNPGTHRGRVGASKIEDQPNMPDKALSFKISKMVRLNKIVCDWLDQEIVHGGLGQPFLNLSML